MTLGQMVLFFSLLLFPNIKEAMQLTQDIIRNNKKRFFLKTAIEDKINRVRLVAHG